jgi:hypothetical protein
MVQDVAAPQQYNAPYYYVHACDIDGTTVDNHGGEFTRNFLFSPSPDATLNSIFEPGSRLLQQPQFVRHGWDMGKCSLRYYPLYLGSALLNTVCPCFQLQECKPDTLQVLNLST